MVAHVVNKSHLTASSSGLVLARSVLILYVPHPVKYHSTIFEDRATEGVFCDQVFPQVRGHQETQIPSTGKQAMGGCKTGGAQGCQAAGMLGSGLSIPGQSG